MRSTLRETRRLRTLTQMDMAHLLGCTQAVYSRYESGKINPPYHVQLRISGILGTPVEQLFPVVERETAAKP